MEQCKPLKTESKDASASHSHKREALTSKQFALASTFSTTVWIFIADRFVMANMDIGFVDAVFVSNFIYADCACWE